MLDIGGWEFLVVAFVLIMVVGPKELPAMLRGFTRFMRQVRSMAAEFSRGMQDMADEAELGDIKGTLSQVKRGNLSGVADALDPDGKAGSAGKEMAATVNKPTASQSSKTKSDRAKPATKRKSAAKPASR
jgi:sec-independent protein translocase protein TatB